MTDPVSVTMNRACRNHPDRFCYICGTYIFGVKKIGINSFIENAYRAYFGIKLGDPDKPFDKPPLVNRDKIILPPLHIKLGLMKQFVKALPLDGDVHKYLREKFVKLSDMKIKAEIFDGPQIKDDAFEEAMSLDEKSAWRAFKYIVADFLSNHRSVDYECVVQELLHYYHKIGARMSLKMHFLSSHLDFFPANCGDYSEEQGERFHQDIKAMENRYLGQWNDRMLADYCWCLKRNVPNVSQRALSKQLVQP